MPPHDGQSGRGVRDLGGEGGNQGQGTEQVRVRVKMRSEGMNVVEKSNNLSRASFTLDLEIFQVLLFSTLTSLLTVAVFCTKEKKPLK